MAAEYEKSLNQGIGANEIEVVAPEIVSGCNAVRLCDPEYLFEMIEQCKLCGRCI